MYLLRPYQIQITAEVLANLKKGLTRQLIVSPTGSGKSVLYEHFIQTIPHRTAKVVVTQSLDVDKAEARLHALGIHDVPAVTVQKLIYDFKREDIDILIVDEAHHMMAETWVQIFSLINAKIVLGYTATPTRLDSRPFLVENGGVFDAIVDGPSITALTEQGYSSNIVCYSAPIIDHPVKVEFLYGGSMEWNEPEVVDERNFVVDRYQELCSLRQALCFCPNIQYAQDVAQEFNKQGIPADNINYKLSKRERHAVIDGFLSGKTYVITTCNLINESFDTPNVEAVIMMQKIKLSVSRYMQQIGRMLRPKPNKLAVLLDLVGNLYNFGQPEDVRYEVT